MLQEPNGIERHATQISVLMAFLDPVIRHMAAATGTWFQNRFISIADASPFLVFWPYHIMSVLLQAQRHHNIEYQHVMVLMQEKLRIMSGRWLLGGRTRFRT